MTDFKREIIFRPAFDKRDFDPKKNYGIHGVECAFYLTGKSGTIQFVIYTNWQLPHVAEEHERRPDHFLCRPLPADLGYHSPKPMYEGQTTIGQKCQFVEGDCYYDGSSLNADRVFKILLEGGSDAVWKELEKEYGERFEKAKP